MLNPIIYPINIRFLIFLLVIMSCLSPLSMDIYLPALTVIMNDFSTNYEKAQLSLNVFLIGVSFFQLIFGPLSDKFGRRPILWLGISIYLFSTFLCIISTSIDMLNFARFLQGIGACGTSIASFAIARDIFEGKEGAKMIAIISSAIGLIPVLAPMLGTYLQLWFGWRSNFVFLFLFAVSILILTQLRLPETRTPHAAASLKHVFRNYRQVMQHTPYQIFSLCGVLGFGSLVAYVSNAPYYLINLGEVSIPFFSLLFGINACAFISGSFLTSQLTHKVSLESLIFMGGSCIFIGGILQGLLLVLLPFSIFSIVGAMLVCTFGCALVMPATMAGALAPFRHISGSAAAMSGCIRFLGSALLGVLVGILQTYSLLALSIILTLNGMMIMIAIHRQRVTEMATETAVAQTSES